MASATEGRLFQPLTGKPSAATSDGIVDRTASTPHVVWTGQECWGAQSFGTTDVCGLLLDADAGELHVYRNGVPINNDWTFHVDG